MDSGANRSPEQSGHNYGGPERSRQNKSGPFADDPRAGAVGENNPNTGIEIAKKIEPEESGREPLFREDSRGDEIFDGKKETGIDILESGKDKSSAEMNSGAGSRPDNGDDSGPNVVDGEVVDDNFEGEKGEDKKENNYSWKEFSDKVSIVIGFERLVDVDLQIVNDLESVGINIKTLFEVDKDTSDIWEIKRIGRELLGQILNDIENLVELDINKKSFFVDGLGISEEKLNEWISEVQKEKGGEKKKAEPGQSENKNGGETEEKRKARLAEEAKIKLDDIFNLGLEEDRRFSLNQWLRENPHATPEDKTRASLELVRLKLAEDVEKARVDAQKVADLVAEKAAADALVETERLKKVKVAKEALAVIIRSKTEDDVAFEKSIREWILMFGKDSPGDATLAQTYIEGILVRKKESVAENNATLDQEKQKKQLEQDKYIRCARQWRNLREDPRKQTRDTEIKSLWMDDVTWFVSSYEDNDDQRVLELVENARRELKEVRDRLSKEICSDEWGNLQKELKITYPGTPGRVVWINNTRLFITKYETSIDSQILGWVDQAREKVKVAESEQLNLLGTAGKTLGTVGFGISALIGKTGLLNKLWSWTDTFAPKK